jgi:hypothetical protein
MKKNKDSKFLARIHLSLIAENPHVGPAESLQHMFRNEVSEPPHLHGRVVGAEEEIRGLAGIVRVRHGDDVRRRGSPASKVMVGILRR